MSETSHNSGGPAAQGSGEAINTIDRVRNVFGTYGSAPEFFPFNSYRTFQRETLEEIETAFKTYKYVLYEGPTGSGKSSIGIALARQSGSAHYLTLQKVLESQLENDFGGEYTMTGADGKYLTDGRIVAIKGRNAYACNYETFETAATAQCTRKKEFHTTDCVDCFYYNTLDRAQRAEVTIHNFHSFYFQTRFGRRFSPRKLLIVDEAHGIENIFVDFMSFKLTSKMDLGQGSTMRIPKFPNIEDYDTFLKTVLSDLELEFKTLEELMEESVLGSHQGRRYDDLRSLIHKIGPYLYNRTVDKPTEYVFDYYESVGGSYNHVEFRPVRIGNFARDTLFKYGERVLMMSATILDKELFCRSVGLDPKDVYFVQVPSTFPAKNRQIVKKYVGYMTRKHKEKTLPNLVAMIEYILSRHVGHRGIIHTHNEEIAEYIKANLFDPRLTFNKDYPNPEAMLEVHCKKEGSIIVASGLREGLDLYGDLSRIQIFCKVPYPSMGDKRIRRLMEIDESWYGYATSLMWIQMLGRSVRSETDKAVSYLLDSDFGNFYWRNKQYIPRYIKEAIRA